MYLPEKYRTRVLLAPQATGTAAGGYVAPTPGAKKLTLSAVALMGNAADLAISLKYADDASGTNSTAFPVNVPVYINGVRQTDAKAATITDSTGNFIVDFCVDAGLIPDGKTIGLAYANSNAANLIAATLVEETAYSNTPT